MHRYYYGWALSLVCPLSAFLTLWHVTLCICLLELIKHWRGGANLGMSLGGSFSCIYSIVSSFLTHSVRTTAVSLLI